MIALLAQLLPVAQQALLAGFVTFLRVGAAMALLPGFGEAQVPQRVKLALALGFTLVVAPAVTAQTLPLAQRGAILDPFLATEVIVGLALGLVLRLIVLVLQMAGQVAAQATSLSQLFGGTGAEPQPAISHLMVAGGLALAVMGGLHLRLAEALILSYQVLPAGGLPAGADLAGWGSRQIAQAFALAVTLAMPFVIGALIYNLALGVINRAMPQLMVAFVGAPALTLGGLLLLLLAAPAMLELWRNWAFALLANPFGSTP